MFVYGIIDKHKKQIIVVNNKDQTSYNNLCNKINLDLDLGI